MDRMSNIANFMRFYNIEIILFILFVKNQLISNVILYVFIF